MRVSIPYPLMSSKDTRTMLNFAYVLCSSAMFVSDVLGVGYGQVFQCAVSLCVARRAQARACLSTGTPCDRCFSDLGRACARGGEGNSYSRRRDRINLVPNFNSVQM